MPGHQLQVNVKFIEPLGQTGRRRKFYQFTAIDDCTRLRVLRAYPRCDQKTATAVRRCCKCSYSDLLGVPKGGLTRGNSGAKGTRTPNPLLAKSRHWPRSALLRRAEHVRTPLDRTEQRGHRCTLLLYLFASPTSRCP
jgi:hypothetical protein